MRIITLCSITAAILLSGCATQAAPTLEQKLAGKSPAEKQEILRLECLNESEHVGNPPRRLLPANRAYVMRKDTQQTLQLKEICRGMTENYSSTDNNNQGAKK